MSLLPKTASGKAATSSKTQPSPPPPYTPKKTKGPINDLGDENFSAIKNNQNDYCVENLAHWNRDASYWREDQAPEKDPKGAKNLALIRNALLAVIPFERFESLKDAFDHYRDHREKSVKIITTTPPSQANALPCGDHLLRVYLLGASSYGQAVVVRFIIFPVKWLVILAVVAGVIGSASAFFLWALDAVTRVRFGTPGLVFLLPVAGLLMGVIAQRYGKSSAAGTNLLIDEIHQPGAGVPQRMAPLIFFGTILTHVFGGSAGREGTAVQMGGGIAAGFARWLKLDAAGVRILLMAGVAAGFGSVFGTPIAGAVFALEVLVIGRMQYDALIPCFAAAVVADWTCRAWGISHTSYVVSQAPSDPWLLGKVVLAGLFFGWVARLFSVFSHGLTEFLNQKISRPELRPVVGGFLVLGLLFLCGSSDYLGLGVLGSHPGAVTLPSLFTSQPISNMAWLWKLVFTVVTLSSGFKGGEVTPLFFIGAALGHTLAVYLGAPVDLFAALGFVAIFAGASKTPIASTLLGLELFGAGNGIYIAAACLVAYRCSGPQGIYRAQRLA